MAEETVSRLPPVETGGYKMIDAVRTAITTAIYHLVSVRFKGRNTAVHTAFVIYSRHQHPYNLGACHPSRLRSRAFPLGATLAATGLVPGTGFMTK